MKHVRSALISLFIIASAYQFAHSNSVYFAMKELKPWYWGVNSEIYNLYSRKGSGFSTTYLALKPYIEYVSGSWIVSPNIRFATDDAFMLTVGAEVGPTFGPANPDFIGYNLRGNFTLLKFGQIGVGIRSEKLIGKPHLLGEFAIGSHIPIFGKSIFEDK